MLRPISPQPVLSLSLLLSLQLCSRFWYVFLILLLSARLWLQQQYPDEFMNFAQVDSTKNCTWNVYNACIAEWFETLVQYVYICECVHSTDIGSQSTYLRNEIEYLHPPRLYNRFISWIWKKSTIDKNCMERTKGCIHIQIHVLIRRHVRWTIVFGFRFQKAAF